MSHKCLSKGFKGEEAGLLESTKKPITSNYSIFFYPSIN